MVTERMLDWNDLQYVLALDEGKTMRRAAELLQTNATTVSRHIKALSEERGAALFTRDKDGHCYLTHEGKQLRELAIDLRDRLQELDARAETRREHEIVTITSLEFLLTHMLAPKIDQGMASFPDTRIHLIGSDRRLSLAYGEADMALRFGRPSEGQLIASKIAEVEFHIWQPVHLKANEWVGLEEELDWTPEMQMGAAHFGKPPAIRVSSFVAARNAAISLGYNFISPAAVVCPQWESFSAVDCEPVKREVWSVIHETQKHSQRLAAVRLWAKNAVHEGVGLSHTHLREFCERPKIVHDSRRQ